MGIVYKARQLGFNRVVALKMILAGPHASSEALTRFRAEAEAVARLRHPNVVQVYEIGEVDNRPFFSMEYVEGGSLDRVLDGTPLPVRRAAELVEVLARAIALAHKVGIVHRDLKPANILFSGEWPVASGEIDKEPSLSTPHSSLATAKITDFGLAKRLDDAAGPTSSGDILGTPSYMAPEQASGKNRTVGPPADIYALGAILYDLMTGRPPFKAETPLDTVFQVLETDAVSPRRLQPKIPRDLETVCLKCLEKEPRKRYPDADGLADDLRRYLDGLPVLARPVSLLERCWRWCRRRPALAGLTAALVGLTVGSIVALTWLWLEAEAGRRAAEQERARASANFQLARDAVDRFSNQVSESRLLNEPGLQPLRRELLQTSREFLERFVERQREDPGVRSDLGTALFQLARMLSTVDAPGEALGPCQEAAEIFATLVQAHPEDAGYRDLLAQCRNRLGTLFATTGEADGAEKAYQEAIGLWNELERASPDAQSYQSRRAMAQSNLGVLYRDTSRLEAAESAYRQALEIRERLAKEHADRPAYQSDLGDSYTNLAGLLRFSDDPARAREALAFFQHDLAIREKLAGSFPDVIDYQSSLAKSYNNLGNVYRHRESMGEAATFLEKGLHIREKLVRKNPAVLTFQDELAGSFNNLGILYRETGQLTKASAACDQALALWRRLAEDHPDVPSYALSLGGAYLNRGSCDSTADQRAQALEWYGQSIQTLEPLVARQHNLAAARTNLRNAFWWRASDLGRLERYGDALKDYDRALELAGDSASRDEMQVERLGALAHLGRHSEASAQAAKLGTGHPIGPDTAYQLAGVYALCYAAALRDRQVTASGPSKPSEVYATTALTLLAGARKAGYFNTAANRRALKEDRSFDSLRSQDEFKKLVQAIETDSYERATPH
jgi:tetratricopeptide (TPR) repeat protein